MGILDSIFGNTSSSLEDKIAIYLALFTALARADGKVDEVELSFSRSFLADIPGVKGLTENQWESIFSKADKNMVEFGTQSGWISWSKKLTEEDKDEQDAEENEKLKSEIKEHRKVINFMRKQLNEVNLMNAKLLFSNKLFRAFGLNNNQKLKVVENFDRTTNLREVKLVYATLAESFKKPSRISESVKKGSSSKPTRSTKPVKEVLSEGAELKARFKKLANIL